MDFAEIKRLCKQLFTNLSENIEATPERFWMWWGSVSVLEMLSFSVSIILLFVVLIVAGIAKLTDSIPKAEKAANTNQSSPAPAPTSSNSYSNRMMNANRYVSNTAENTNSYTSAANTITPSRNRPQDIWRVKAATVLRSEASDISTAIETLSEGDSVIMNYRYGSTRFYNVTTASGQSGWIDGYAIEETGETVNNSNRTMVNANK